MKIFTQDLVGTKRHGACPELEPNSILTHSLNASLSIKHNSVEFGKMCAQHFLSVLQPQRINTNIIPILQIRKKKGLSKDKFQ